MRSIDQHTAVARQHIAGDIVAAIPAFGDEQSKASSTTSTFFGLVLRIVSFVAVFAVPFPAEWSAAQITLARILILILILILNRIIAGLLDSPNDATKDEVLFVLRPDRVDVVSGTAKNPKSVLESHPVESIRLWRPDDVMTGRISVGGSEWFISPWHEKQILRTLSPLGADLSGIPQVAIDNLLGDPPELRSRCADEGHS